VRIWARPLGCFPASSDKDVPAAIDRVIAVAANAEPARFVAGSMERKKSRGYLYQFTRLPGTERARKLGAYHGVDLAYVFGNIKTSDGYDDTDVRLSAEMMDYWVNFARSGDPNGQGLPYWPAYERALDLNLEFSGTLRIGRHLFKEECDFIQQSVDISFPVKGSGRPDGAFAGSICVSRVYVGRSPRS
jgi:para-nitrobenzyl esterase